MVDGPSQCPRCGGALDYDREVEKAVRYNDDMALVKVRADVCTQCGERLFRPEMIDLMEQARESMKKSGKAPVIGRVYDYRSFRAS